MPANNIFAFTIPPNKEKIAFTAHRKHQAALREHRLGGTYRHLPPTSQSTRLNHKIIVCEGKEELEKWAKTHGYHVLWDKRLLLFQSNVDPNQTPPSNF